MRSWPSGGNDGVEFAKNVRRGDVTPCSGTDGGEGRTQALVDHPGGVLGGAFGVDVAVEDLRWVADVNVSLFGVRIQPWGQAALPGEVVQRLTDVGNEGGHVNDSGNVRQRGDGFARIHR